MTTPLVRKCGPCYRGMAPGQEPTFDPECPGCQAKLAAGKRTGLEPHPGSAWAAKKRASRGTAEQFRARRAREDRQNANRARRELSFPKPEVGR